MYLCILFVCSDYVFCFFFFKQKTADEMRISDWSSDVCSSDLQITGRQPADEKHRFLPGAEAAEERDEHTLTGLGHATIIGGHCLRFGHYPGSRSERRWSAMSLARPAP